MANYATNIFHASTENKQDLDKIEAFLDDNFNGFVNLYGDTVDRVILCVHFIKAEFKSHVGKNPVSYTHLDVYKRQV